MINRYEVGFDILGRKERVFIQIKSLSGPMHVALHVALSNLGFDVRTVWHINSLIIKTC